MSPTNNRTQSRKRGSPGRSKYLAAQHLEIARPSTKHKSSPGFDLCFEQPEFDQHLGRVKRMLGWIGLERIQPSQGRSMHRPLRPPGGHVDRTPERLPHRPRCRRNGPNAGACSARAPAARRRPPCRSRAMVCPHGTCSPCSRAAARCSMTAQPPLEHRDAGPPARPRSARRLNSAVRAAGSCRRSTSAARRGTRCTSAACRP